jgi:formylmethanofuran dehydrogenase subunit C
MGKLSLEGNVQREIGLIGPMGLIDLTGPVGTAAAIQQEGL